MTEKAKPLSYLVVCRDDTDAEGNPGPYILATRTVFDLRSDAVYYARSINSHREPIVVVGDFSGLRFGELERIRRLAGRAL